MRGLLSLLLCGGLGVGVLRGAPVPTLVSGPARPGATPGGGSYQPVLNADGRFVAFVSSANNLVPNSGRLPYLNIYLRDRLAGQLTLISVNTNDTGGADDNCVGAAVSADGRFIAFQSAAGNLAANDTNGVSDVFLRDRIAGITTLVSRQRDGQSADRRPSSAPLLSANGRWLVYESYATNLVANDTNDAPDIFVFDRETGVNALVSVNAEGNGSRAGASLQAAMTPDGQWVAYVNYLSNSSTRVGPISHLYVRHWPDGATLWASSNAAAQLSLSTYYGASLPALSADGSSLYFKAYSAFFTNLYRFEIASGLSTLIGSAPGPSMPSPSADGRYVAYEQTNLVRVWDARTSNAIIASVSQTGAPAPSRDGPARPVLSADGTKVTFLSNAGSLTTDPTNGSVQLYQRDLSSGTTRLLSADTNGTASGNLASIVPAVTADAAVVAFESPSTTMVPDDLNQAADVFVRDGVISPALLVSGRDPALPSSSASAVATLYPNSISADGRHVAYASYDTGTAGDTNGVQDIFVRDLQSGSVQPVSVSASGAFTNQFHSQDCVLSADGRRVAWVVAASGFSGYGSVFWRDVPSGEIRVVSDMFNDGAYSRNAAPTISADGRWVAFETTRSSQTFEPSVIDANSGADIVLQDVVAGTNVVISRAWDGERTGNGPSTAPQFSPDGRWLAFASQAQNLTAQIETTTATRLFVRDLVNQTTYAVSSGPYVGRSSPPTTYAGQVTFSGDSRHLAYNAPGGYVLLYDLMTNTRITFCYPCWDPSLSEHGEWLAVRTQSLLASGYRVMLINENTGDSTLIGTNLASGAYSPADSVRNPLVSSDGRYLVFVADRASGSPLASPGLYVRDLARGLTMSLPIGRSGGPGNGPTTLPQLAADGRTLAFVSFANDLVSGDENARRDVFAVKIGSPDTDGDGLDDDWEMAYFNDLSRDGSGDFDHDGQSDRAEFLAGTDPTNKGSVLSAMVVVDATAATAVIIWNSVPGRTYEVQYKDAVADDWSILDTGVLATEATRSVVDHVTPRPAQRFYRLRFAP